MKISQLYHIILLTLIGMLLLPSCSDSDADLGAVGGHGGVDSIYVTLSIDVADGASTRAGEVPNGGEEGDGWEYGRSYENELHNFTVFILGNYANVNSAASTQFEGSRYFSEEDVATATKTEHDQPNAAYPLNRDVLTYDFTIPLIHDYPERLPEASSFRFLIVANAGDLTTTYTTLGALRDDKPVRTWSEATVETPTANHFVMTNENDQYYSHGSGLKDDPVRLHVTIERMAARIDFDPKGAKIDGADQHLYYELKATEGDASSATLANLHVDRMAVVNGCEKPSYFIKRVADDIRGTNLIYLGLETPTPNGIATNYVIDPYSVQKTEANRSNTGFLTNLFGSSRISESAALLNADASKLPAFTSTTSPHTLGYVNENTYAKEMAVKEYATGVVVQCRFEPKHNYYTAYNAETDVLTEGTYTLGQTYWMVEPNQPTVSEADRLYFSTREAAEAYATNTAHKHFGKVVEYPQGICYYYLYLRHSNNVAVVHNTMEFGIVRNNLYRFVLTSVTGPGTPTLDPRDPEELKARVYVKKWLMVEHPPIYL